MSMYLRPWIPKHAWAKFNRGQSVQVQAQVLRIPNQWGTTHMVLPHFWSLILTPYISQTPPVFINNCHSKSYFFHTVQNFGNFSLKDPKSARIWEKGTQMPLFLWLLSLKDPHIFCLACMCVRGMLLPQTRSEAGQFCILETESCNLVNIFRCKFIKGDENKISVLQARPTQLCIMDELHWRVGMMHRPYHHPGQTRKGIYPTTILYMILYILAL